MTRRHYAPEDDEAPRPRPNRAPARSLDAMRAARNLTEGDPSALLVLLILLTHAGPDDGWECFTGLRRLALETHLSVGTVRRALVRLEGLGIVARLPREEATERQPLRIEIARLIALGEAGEPVKTAAVKHAATAAKERRKARRQARRATEGGSP